MYCDVVRGHCVICHSDLRLLLPPWYLKLFLIAGDMHSTGLFAGNDETGPSTNKYNNSLSILSQDLVG